MLWTEELDNEMRSLYDEYVAYDDKPEGKVSVTACVQEIFFERGITERGLREVYLKHLL